nr:flagellar hook-length control protein FliK [uncultured Tolumonas sp.]
MAVSALTNNATLLTTGTTTVATNSSASTPTETAATFSLPDDTPHSPAVMSDDGEPQTAANCVNDIATDDSAEATDTAIAPVVMTPTLDSDQLSSQLVTPLQLALGQTFSESSTETAAPTLSSLPTAASSQSQANVDARAPDTDSTTALLQATSSNEPHVLALNSTGKINVSSGKNTPVTDTENSRTTSSSDNSSQSLNISVLTLPAMPSAQPNTSILTTTASNVDNGLLSSSAVTAATTPSVMTSTTSNNNISNWLTASTTATSFASTMSNSNFTPLSGKLTSDTNPTTNQSLTQILSELSLFADSTSLSATPNIPLPSSSTTSTTQQLGEQLLDTLKQQVSTQLSQKTQQTTIRLDPPSLGQLAIAIRIDGDKMTVQINAEHSGVRESLQNSREQLRQLLSTEHNGTIDVDIGQQQSSTPQQRQPSYAQTIDPDIISAPAISSDTTATAASSEPAATGDWLNTVV